MLGRPLTSGGQTGRPNWKAPMDIAAPSTVAPLNIPKFRNPRLTADGELDESPSAAPKDATDATDAADPAAAAPMAAEEATIEEVDVSEASLGDGGAHYCFECDVEIRDTTFSDNWSTKVKCVFSPAESHSRDRSFRPLAHRNPLVMPRAACSTPRDLWTPTIAPRTSNLCPCC